MPKRKIRHQFTNQQKKKKPQKNKKVMSESDEDSQQEDKRDECQFSFGDSSGDDDSCDGDEAEDDGLEDYDDDEDDEVHDESKGSKEPEVRMPEESILSRIKNKLKRRELYEKYLEQKTKEKKAERKKRCKEREAMGPDAPPKLVPKTIESMREADITMVNPNDEEVKEDEALDEFSSYFRKDREPKIIITTSDNPHTKTIKFGRELKQTIPNSEFRWRNRSSIKKMVKTASAKGYTDIMVINEDVRRPNGLLVIHLPDGPTAHFKLSSVKYCKEIKHRAKLNEKRPEVVLNNFNTRLGHTVGRMFASLFHFEPEFHGKRVVTFHNQRDFIFFRHHRYDFKNGKRVALQEVGPRFTLKLRWIQKGTFDTKTGEYEWLLKRHEMETSRRRFFL